MKLFLITNMYPSKKNPMYGVFVKNMMNGLVEEGGTITSQAVISKRPKGMVQYLGLYGGYFIQGLLGLFKKFDLIYCHFVLHNAPLALMVQFLSRKPLVVNIHGTDMLGKGRIVKLLGPFRCRLLAKASLIVVPSAFMMHRTMALTGLPEDKFFISPSGGIHLPPKVRAPSKAQEEIIFGYVGSIARNKGIFTLLEALKDLSQSKVSPDWKLIVAGAGPDEALFLEKAKHYGLDHRVEWRGLVSQKELAVIYPTLTLLIFPTLLEESLGLVGLEAMAHGVPVIGSKIGGLQDYIVDQKNGVLYEAGDARALFSILKKMCLEPENISNMQSQARATAQEFEATITAENLYKQLRSLV